MNRPAHRSTPGQKITVTLDRRTVADLDRWVREGRYPNRSQAVQSAVGMLRECETRARLLQELSKLDSQEEQQLAEEGIGADLHPVPPGPNN